MRKFFVIALVVFAVFATSLIAADPVILRFYFPVGVAGPLARYMGELADKFNSTHPDIIVEPIYSGGYPETLQRALTASKAGNPPDVALLTAADIWTAADEKIIISLESFIEAEGGETFLEPYFQAFLEDCDVAGELYAIPFQKSTPIFYYNKDMFREAGLDPDRPPSTWTELKEYATKLAKKEGGNTVRWGVEIPIDQWLLSAFIMQNGGLVNNQAGTETYLNSPEAIGALEFMRSLVAEGLMPARRLFCRFCRRHYGHDVQLYGQSNFCQGQRDLRLGCGLSSRERQKGRSDGWWAACNNGGNTGRTPEGGVGIH